MHRSRSLPARGLVVVAIFVTACGGAAASPTPTASPVATIEAVPPTAGPTPTMQPAPSVAASARPTADPLAAKLLAAVDRAKAGFAEIEGASKEDWPAFSAALITSADIYDAFAREVEALDGATHNLRSDHSAALIGYSKQIAIVLRKVAAADSWDAAMAETVEWLGSSYTVESFLQDAIGEWGAALSLVLADLGADLPTT